MGCGASNSRYLRRHKSWRDCDCVTKEWKATFVTLGLQEKELAKLWKCFCKMDVDASGEVDSTELLMQMDVERTKFTSRCFSMFDTSSDKRVDFHEFVIAVWNYCTMSRAALISFSFDLYDGDLSGDLTEEELRQILSEVYGSSAEKRRTFERAARSACKLDPIGDAVVTKEGFMEFVRTHPTVLFPAFDLQGVMRRKFVGVSFWNGVAARRDCFEASVEDNIATFVQDVMRGKHPSSRGIGGSSTSGTIGAARRRRSSHSSASRSNGRGNDGANRRGSAGNRPSSTAATGKASTSSTLTGATPNRKRLPKLEGGGLARRTRRASTGAVSPAFERQPLGAPAGRPKSPATRARRSSAPGTPGMNEAWTPGCTHAFGRGAAPRASTTSRASSHQSTNLAVAAAAAAAAVAAGSDSDEEGSPSAGFSTALQRGGYTWNHGGSTPADRVMGRRRRRSTPGSIGQRVKGLGGVGDDPARRLGMPNAATQEIYKQADLITALAPHAGGRRTRRHSRSGGRSPAISIASQSLSPSPAVGKRTRRHSAAGRPSSRSRSRTRSHSNESAF